VSIVEKGQYRARFAETAEEIASAQRLRYRCFRARETETSAAKGALDQDEYDARCRHVLVERRATGHLLGCYRVLILSRSAEIEASYSARFYDLNALAGYPHPMAELGRFCIARGALDPDIIRIAWGALTALVDQNRIGMLFGCTSFRGTSVAPYRNAFALLHRKYLAPKRWMPGIKARTSVPLQPPELRAENANLSHAMKEMPPLLRSYLTMGGRVSDHAVIDSDLDTIHVFTALDIEAIPPTRARLLRAISA